MIDLNVTNLFQEMEKSQRRDEDADPLTAFTDSQILKFGQAALRKTQTSTLSETDATKTDKIVTKESFFTAFSVVKQRSEVTHFFLNVLSHCRVSVVRFWQGQMEC